MMKIKLHGMEALWLYAIILYKTTYVGLDTLLSSKLLGSYWGEPDSQ